MCNCFRAIMLQEFASMGHYVATQDVLRGLDGVGVSSLFPKEGP